MARHAKPFAKRANRPNPREDRNQLFPNENIAEFDGNRERRSATPKAKPVALVPRNLAQETYLETLRDSSKDIIFAMGPAGTGKTMLATLFAIQEYRDGNCEKIMITRPAVSVEEQHGFLPGSIIDKLLPWVTPIIDVFKEVYHTKSVEKMLQDEIIEIAPLAYMRGRTMKNAIVIADEMQNATVSQMKMLLTRIGENSRMIVTGDLRQHDGNRFDNGLRDFVERLRLFNVPRIAVCDFTAADVERHPVIGDILRIYGDE